MPLQTQVTQAVLDSNVSSVTNFMCRLIPPLGQLGKSLNVPKQPRVRGAQQRNRQRYVQHRYRRKRSRSATRIRTLLRDELTGLVKGAEFVPWLDDVARPERLLPNRSPLSRISKQSGVDPNYEANLILNRQ